MHSLLLPLLLLLAGPGSSELCPGGEVRCPENMTCCPLANHMFGCCTYPQAQCCNDHIHCCPHDMKCDERNQACLKNGFPAAFFSRLSASPDLIEKVQSSDVQPKTNEIDKSKSDTICPDGHQCHRGFTCCQMYNYNYGCCPYSKAKCCKDGFHCCPHGSECDPVTGGCHSGSNWLSKAAPLIIKGQQPSKEDVIEVADPGGKCPDGHPCLEKFTCCKVADGGYGCCPYTNAICCNDHIHCCPKNTNCNISMGTCDVERSFSVPAYSMATLKLTRVPPIPKPLSAAAPPPSPSSSSSAAAATAASHNVSSIVCPDHNSSCKDGETCCRNLSDSYSCCPLPQATCCSNKESCCPHGYQCIGGRLCQRSSLPFLPPAVQKSSVLTSEPSAIADSVPVKCPDKTMCPEENTCCNISPSRYGCCPMPLATCCGDMQSCCPHGYWCTEDSCERAEGANLNKTMILHNSVNHSPSILVLP